MPIIPEGWNVNIVGFWNRAIYTPAGIVRHLFQLPPSTPVQVLIPLDLPAPYQVQYEDQTVVVGSDRLIVTPVRPNFVSLADALKIGRRALDHLPNTPLIAAGFNVRYKSDGPVAVLDEIVANRWDERLSDLQLEIRERSVTRAVRRNNGKINVTVSQKEDLTFFLELNFDLQSDDVAQLRAWIDVSDEDLQREVERILYNSIEIRREEVAHG